MRRLEEGSIRAWARRGWARQFERPRETPRVPLREVADAALKRAGGLAREHWRERVAAIDPAVVEGAVSSVPELSDATATFVTQVILTNRELILDHS